MFLIKIIFITTAFAATPVLLKLGPVSLSAVITTFIFVFAIIVFLINPKIQKTSFLALIPLALFWIYSLYWYIFQSSIKDITLSNYPVVWGGLLFIPLAVSKVSIENNKNYNQLEKIISLSSYLYISVLCVLVFTGAEDPATTQVGMIFFSYYLSRLISIGRLGSILPLITIFLLQLVMKSRIVVIAELLILVIAGFVSKRTYHHGMKSLRYRRLILFIILFVSIVFVIVSGFSDKTSGGDVALEIGTITINTSGRWHAWNVIMQSATQSIWFGHGTAMPDELSGVERWDHPHNDYLRIIHQLGFIGLFFWLIFIILNILITRKCVRQYSDYSVGVLCHTALYSLVGMSVMMLTDNTIVYSYIAFPVGVFIGIVLSLYAANKKKRKLVKVL